MPADLRAAAGAADTPAAILAVVARATWAKAHNGAECPPNRIPEPAALAAWLPEVPGGGPRHGRKRLAAVIAPDPETVRRLTGFYAEAMGAFDWPPACQWTDRDGELRTLVTWTGGDGAMLLSAPLGLEEVHAEWCAADDPHPHPLASLVDAWQRTAPVPVEVDRHARAILPASLRDAARDHETLPLALDRTTPLGPIGKPEQGWLPGLEPARSVVPPVPWLTLYDMTGSGPVQTRGRGAPLAQRLFVEVLTAVHAGSRDPE